MDPDPHCLFFAATGIGGLFAFKVLVLLILLLCSALISGVEVALFGLTQSDRNSIAEGKSKTGNMLLRLLEKPKKLLATILITNNTINIAIVLLFSQIADELFPMVENANIGIVSFRTIFEILVATVLILLFGEILPKIYASRNKIPFSTMMARPLNILDVILTPLSNPMQAGTIFLEDNLGRKKSNLNVDQLSQALELTSDDMTNKEEQKILEGIVTFGNTDTKQVMRPRIDIFALNQDAKFTEVLEEIKKHGFSRIPVYEESIDAISGVLYVKDLLPFLDRKTFNWPSLLREPIFVPENKKLDDLLLEFQEQKNHLAIVVDEYGGTSGIVTLEDVIEEIVGDISDEFDDEDLIYSKLDDFTYVFEGKTNLRDFYKVVKVSEGDEELFEQRKGESETIAGFVLEVAGRFPRQGEKITFGEYEFIVEALDKKRLKQIKVNLPKNV